MLGKSQHHLLPTFAHANRAGEPSRRATATSCHRIPLRVRASRKSEYLFGTCLRERMRNPSSHSDRLPLFLSCRTHARPIELYAPPKASLPRPSHYLPAWTSTVHLRLTDSTYSASHPPAKTGFRSTNRRLHHASWIFPCVQRLRPRKNFSQRE